MRSLPWEAINRVQRFPKRSNIDSVLTAGSMCSIVRLPKIGLPGGMNVQKRHNRDGLWNVEFNIVS